MIKEGIITKGIGGFYYILSDGEIYEARAKGKFRKCKITPLAGDRVIFSVNDLAENTIDEILPRKNFLVRPPVANIDILFIVVSTCEPVPNTFVIDKTTVLAEKRNIQPVIIITKSDLAPADKIFDAYQKTPYKVFLNTQIEEIKSLIQGNLCAFTGNSGVGKTTLLNAIAPNLNQPTAQISQKLGRGRHTTRQAEIFCVSNGMIIDTAGFSSLEFQSNEIEDENDIQFYFPEFEDLVTSCKFTGCAHLGDKGCAISDAAQKGEIALSRYESYKQMYLEAKKNKKW